MLVLMLCYCYCYCPCPPLTHSSRCRELRQGKRGSNMLPGSEMIRCPW